MRQVVGHRHPLAVARDGGVAGVDTGPHFGHHLEVPQIELGDPAIARGKEDVAAIRRELRPAVQRIARLKAMNRFQLVAIEDRHMMIAAFDNHEEVERIGLEHRLVGQGLLLVQNARGGDLLLTPGRHRLDRRIGVIDQRLDLLGRELVAKTQHLTGRAALANDLLGFRLAQTRQVFRQQRGADAAQAVGTVAGSAVLLVVGRGIGRFGQLRHADQEVGGKARRDQDFPVTHAISSSLK